MLRTIAAHAATVALTLVLVFVFFGPRLVLRGSAQRGAGVDQSRDVPIAPLDAPSRDLDPTIRTELQTPPAVQAPPAKPEEILKDLDADERNNVSIYANVNKSVVNITTESEGIGFFGDESSSGSGSGFVIDKQGHVMTNFHVIQGAGAVRVTLFDGSTHPAKVIGQDASNDVAVLAVNVAADKLFPVVFGDSSRVMVGQKILALGNPFGLERTLTTGIVSSLDRSLKAKNGRMIKGIIQTDAAINPGNSGGPLLNAHGQVIGMNTAIVSQVGQSAGISFAVPINAIARILKPLIEKGRVIRGDLGIARVYATGEGLLVVQLVPGGPAEEAGIQPAQVRQERLGMGFVRRYLDTDSADLIVAIEHRRVKTVDELLNEVEKHPPGATIRVTVVREEKPVDIQVTLGES
ncbi:S1C family serine protease [Aquisphaera insulae]|uniref:S1C family serine protease n=1 Tax=Aquisphaera insulae TaxID=2712864 RepID=UPI0021BC9A6C|nr:trypsin-like peptidase domain-containing protein [Aquisphaera insulae]